MKNDELQTKVDFLIDVINLAEVYKVIPSTVIERARNRTKIQELKKITLKSLEENEELKNRQEIEVRFQEKFEEQ